MSDEKSAVSNRREVLSTTATLAGVSFLSGCSLLRSGTTGNTGATDVILDNAAADSMNVAVTIADVDADDPHTASTFDVAPGETVDPVNDSKLPTNVSYTVEVSVENGPSETFEWEDPVLERSPLWVRVDDTQNIKFLLQAG